MTERLEEKRNSAARAQNHQRYVDPSKCFMDFIVKPAHELLGMPYLSTLDPINWPTDTPNALHVSPLLPPPRHTYSMAAPCACPGR